MNTRFGGGGGWAEGLGMCSVIYISHTIDSLQSPTPFNTAKQATLQCVQRKSLTCSKLFVSLLNASLQEALHDIVKDTL